MHTIKFSIDNYLAEYLIGKWGKENDHGKIVVELPSEVYLYHCLHSLLKKKPKNALEPSGNVEIITPARKDGWKKPELYSHISEEGVRIFNKNVKLFFRSEFHEYLDYMKFGEGISYKDASYLFLRLYDIVSLDPESVEKNHARWRSKVRERKKIYSTR